MKNDELRYLQRLAELYPTIGKASTEIINLQSILNLPKGTEHFLSDIHGEYEAFSHVLRNGSGAVRKKIDDVFGHTLSNSDKRALATLIYYPKEKIELVKKQEPDMENWYKITLYRLIEVCKTTASKYTRSKVRKALPADYAYVIEELITEKAEVLDKEAYYDSIVDTIIEIGRAGDFIIALAELIQRLVVDHLHVLGDIYDRGPGPHFIMDRLMSYHSLDIQWGNHDVVWMGAAAGQKACIATVIRNCIRYRNLDILEDGYGINILPLMTFAMEAYKDDPCVGFDMKGASSYSALEEKMGCKMHKAISIIQFKLEGKLVQTHKDFGMEDRALLHRIDPEKKTITLPDGKTYPLKDSVFPTVNWEDPYALSPEEEVMERLDSAFRNCEKLQNHMRLLLDKGGLYTTYNGNLLFHGSVPLNEDGSLTEVEIYGEKYRGKALYDALETYVRRAFYSMNEEEREKGKDIMWYIWSAPNSPLFGKDKMTTFERYFIEDKSTHKEKKNAYYRLLEREDVVDGLLREFELDPQTGHIINGHVPVHQSEGESPVKCGGKVIVIDGGFCKAYQKVTGIAGYTLTYNSYGLVLSAHEPFTSKEQAVEREKDIVSNRVAVQYSGKRALVGDTDTGTAVKERIGELIQLLDAYRKGVIKEKK
ncbi:MAG: fructose-1,6-bisphosphatase [Clostridiales bacterium]|nr:fructose-1,6-bisphosphatase [Clostridiales bacterium]